MKYLVAVLCLGLICALWALLQRGAGGLDQPPCEEDEPDCSEDCSVRAAGCSPEKRGPR